MPASTTGKAFTNTHTISTSMHPILSVTVTVKQNVPVDEGVKVGLATVSSLRPTGDQEYV